MRRPLSLLLTILFLTAALPESGAASFFGKREEGWFFYEPEPMELEPPESIEPPTPPHLANTPQPAPVPTAPTPEPLSVEWMRENFQRYVDQAVDSPTPENVRAALYLQRAIMDKSSAFADTAQRVVVGDPYLDEVTRRPLATYAANKANKVAKEGQEEIVAALAKEAGIYFFYSSTCQFCVAQVLVLQALERKYGVQVFPVSVDGLPLPTGDYPNFQVDRGHAQLLNVVQTPALFLVKPSLGFPDGFLPISQGAISLMEAESRVALVAANAGWIDSAEYNRTRPVDTTVTLARKLDGLTEEDVADAGRLVELLRARLKGETE